MTRPFSLSQLCRYSHKRNVCVHGSGLPWAAAIAHFTIMWDSVHQSVLFVITVACHFATRLYINSARSEVEHVFALPLPPPLLSSGAPSAELLSEIASALRGQLMMFLGRVGPPTTESCTWSWGGLIDRLGSWKLHTKDLYRNMCRIKTLHSPSVFSLFCKRVCVKVRVNMKMSVWIAVIFLARVTVFVITGILETPSGRRYLLLWHLTDHRLILQFVSTCLTGLCDKLVTVLSSFSLDSTSHTPQQERVQDRAVKWCTKNYTAQHRLRTCLLL